MSILDILTVLRRGWQIMAISVVASLLLASAYLHTAKYKYSVQLEVAPVETGQGQGGGIGSGFGGLASLAGINLGQGGGNNTFLKYIEDIKSRDVADALAAKPEITHTLFASYWDAETQQWKEPQSVVHTISSTVKGMLGFQNRDWHPPNGADLQGYIGDSIQITRGLQTPFVTLQIVVTDPKFGVYFLMALHHQIDDVLRQKALERATTQISYLTRTLQTVTVAEHRLAIGQALMDQEKTRMSASSSLPFAAEPLGPPSPSASPISPRPALVLGLGGMMGLLLGATILLGWHWLSGGNYLPKMRLRSRRPGLPG